MRACALVYSVQFLCVLLGVCCSSNAFSRWVKLVRWTLIVCSVVASSYKAISHIQIVNIMKADPCQWNGNIEIASAWNSLRLFIDIEKRVETIEKIVRRPREIQKNTRVVCVCVCAYVCAHFGYFFRVYVLLCVYCRGNIYDVKCEQNVVCVCYIGKFPNYLFKERKKVVHIQYIASFFPSFFAYIRFIPCDECPKFPVLTFIYVCKVNESGRIQR